MLTPDKIRYVNGVKISEKIIPWGARWTKDSSGFKKGDLYKSDKSLKSVSYITIHNTNDLYNVADDAEQYTRATYPNQNMGSVRTHFYIDENGAWQNLLEEERGWHAGDGDDGPGNATSISLEIIEYNGKTTNDLKAEDNGARLTAYLLKKYNLGIDRVVTHKKWNGKGCPEFLLPKWDDFIALVEKYLKEPTEIDWEAKYNNLKQAMLKTIETK